MRQWWRAAALAAAVPLLGCASQPQFQTVAGDGYDHRLVVQPSADASELHVYIEGDGSPYDDRTRVAADPTPRNALALRLMRRDPAFSVWVGRPCYFGLAHECNAALWTTHRYSRFVVASMRAVIRELVARYEPQRIVFIGHSGGGTLAMLLAPFFDETVAVITIGANLDVDGWTALHRYAPLHGSLKPGALPAAIRQYHYAGGRDTNVPPQLVPNAIVYERFDHHCCWERVWPRILRYTAVSH